jgi:hypothetical protein
MRNEDTCPQNIHHTIKDPEIGIPRARSARRSQARLPLVRGVILVLTIPRVKEMGLASGVRWMMITWRD